MNDTIDTSAAVDAWVSGNMQRAQELSQPIPDTDPPAGAASSSDIPAYLENHLAVQNLEQKQNAAPAQPNVVDSALSKLTSNGGEHSALVQSWGSDAKENLAYAFEAYKDIVANKPELIDRVDASGLGNDAILLQHLAEHGRLKANLMGDNTVSSRRSAYDEPRPSSNSAAQRELNKIYEDTPPGTPGYAKPSVQARVRQLNEAIYGTEPAVGPRRAHAMSDIDDLPPRMDMHNFALAINSKPFNIFHYKTVHTLDEVMEPGYFDEAAECLIRRHDRVEVIANANGMGEFTTLTVLSVKADRGQAKAVAVIELERR
jgi:hypothetical protein